MSRQMFGWRHGEEGEQLLQRLWDREVERIEEDGWKTTDAHPSLERHKSLERAYIFYIREGGYRGRLLEKDIMFWAVFEEGGDRAAQCLYTLMIGMKPGAIHELDASTGADTAGLLRFVMETYPMLTDLRFAPCTESRARHFKRVMMRMDWGCWAIFEDGTQHWVRLHGKA